MSLQSVGSILTHLRTHSYNNAQEKIELLDKLKATNQATLQNTAWMLTTEDKNYRDFSYAIFSKSKSKETMKILLGEMEGKNDEMIEKMSLIIANLAPTGLDSFLQQHIKLGKPQQKITVLKILKNMGNIEPYIPMYSISLKDANEEVRSLCVHILSRSIQKNEIFTLLCPLLMDKSERIRRRIIKRLTKVKDIKIITVIFEIMSRETKDNQGLLIEALKEIALAMNVDIVDLIIPALMDNQQSIRKSSALFFASLPDLHKSTVLLLNRMRNLSFDIKKKIFKSFQTIEKEITEVIVLLLHDKDLNHRVDALIISMNLNDERIPEGIGSILRENVEWWIKLLGIEILASYKLPQTISILQEHEEDFFLEWAIVSAYGQLQFTEKLPFLQQHLSNESKDIRRAALHSIYKFETPEAMKILEEIATPQCDLFLHTEMKLMNEKNPFPFAIPDLERKNDKEELRVEMEKMGLHLENNTSNENDDQEQSVVLGIDNLSHRDAFFPPEEPADPIQSAAIEEPQYNPQVQPQPNQQIANVPPLSQDPINFVERNANNIPYQSPTFENKNSSSEPQNTIAIPDEPQTNAKYEDTLAIPDEPQPNTKYEDTLAIPDEPQLNTKYEDTVAIPDESQSNTKYENTLAIPDEPDLSQIHNIKKETIKPNPQDSPQENEAMLHNFRSRFHRITSNSQTQESTQEMTEPTFSEQNSPEQQAQPFSIQANNASEKSFQLHKNDSEQSSQAKSHIPTIFSKPKTEKKSTDQKKIPFSLGQKTNIKLNIRKKDDENE
ncbi:HEAT repeat domain-containing protein [Candidatus Uabimicrobium sp. HlEnr_7]|uniref:HEAT repeat domain-containing protein n=1 Tax=Candidatus Uabimicrobium helgolandensis TaxID=3095367 RepID=UPI003556F486